MLTIKIDQHDTAEVTFELPEAEAMALGNRLMASPPSHLRVCDAFDDVVILDTRARCPWGHLTVAVGRISTGQEPLRHGIWVQVQARRETLDYTTQLKTLDLTTHLNTAAVLRTLLAA